MSTDKQNQEKDKDIKVTVETNPWQILVIAVIYIVMFGIPVAFHQVYIHGDHGQPSNVEETYTADALQEDEQEQGRVAGLTTNAVTAPQAGQGVAQSTPGQYTIPLLGIQFSTDLSQPSNLLILLGLVSAVAFLFISGKLVYDSFIT